MSDISEFLAVKKCKVALLPMSDEQRKLFNQAMELSPEEAPSAQARRVLKSWGFALGKDALIIHRKKECACYGH